MAITLDACIKNYFNIFQAGDSKPVKLMEDLKSLQTLLVQSDSALRNAVNGRLNVCPTNEKSMMLSGMGL